MRVLGVDPDLSGGLVLVDFPAQTIEDIVRMPCTEKKPPLNAPARVHVERLWTALLGTRRLGAEYVVLERALVMQQQTPKGPKMMGSVDRTHQNFGAIRALCELAFTPSRVMIANPSVWKKALGLTSDKGLSRDMACSIFPDHEKLFCRVKNTGLAEAALLAVWGKDKFTNG
jgi:hypothetical protein